MLPPAKASIKKILVSLFVNEANSENSKAYVPGKVSERSSFKVFMQLVIGIELMASFILSEDKLDKLKIEVVTLLRIVVFFSLMASALESKISFASSLK